MDDYKFLVQELFENMSRSRFEYLENSIMPKLDLKEFLVNRSYLYQTTPLYKEASNNFMLGGDKFDIAKNQFIELTQWFRSERWKIFYEFGSWCANTYKNDPHWSHKEAGIEFICKGIGCLMATDSPITLNIEEKNYTVFRLLYPVYDLSPEITNDIIVTYMSMMATMANLKRNEL